MKITDVRIVSVKGLLKAKGGMPIGWEDRLLMPLDIYPKYRASPRIREWKEEVELVNVLVETDEGITGMCPIWEREAEFQAYIIQNRLKEILVGEDPFRVEMLWDHMYRSQVEHGRKGWILMAISTLDCALWDLIGKSRGEPVYKLLGGPARDEIEAYASMLGFSVKPKKAAETSVNMVEHGYTAMKWFFKYGPGDGAKGMDENLRLVRMIRDSVGYDVDLMLDAWMGWNRPYALKMLKRLERYEPRWVEEPLIPDDIDGYAVLRASTDIPISCGEHEYTIYGFKQLIDKEAVDILQPDVRWSGGFSQLRKICALAEANGLPVIPHDGFTTIALQLLFSQTVTVCPIAEYLIKHNLISQALLKNPVIPERGFLKLPDKPGLGIEIDEEKITERSLLEHEVRRINM